jgi:hypothetical protein
MSTPNAYGPEISTTTSEVAAVMHTREDTFTPARDSTTTGLEYEFGRGIGDNEPAPSALEAPPIRVNAKGEVINPMLVEARQLVKEAHEYSLPA